MGGRRATDVDRSTKSVCIRRRFSKSRGPTFFPRRNYHFGRQTRVTAK